MKEEESGRNHQDLARENMNEFPKYELIKCCYRNNIVQTDWWNDTEDPVRNDQQQKRVQEQQKRKTKDS